MKENERCKECAKKSLRQPIIKFSRKKNTRRIYSDGETVCRRFIEGYRLRLDWIIENRSPGLLERRSAFEVVEISSCLLLAARSRWKIWRWLLARGGPGDAPRESTTSATPDPLKSEEKTATRNKEREERFAAKGTLTPWNVSFHVVIVDARASPNVRSGRLDFFDNFCKFFAPRDCRRYIPLASRRLNR